jgi:hypothetical protein
MKFPIGGMDVPVRVARLWRVADGNTKEWANAEPDRKAHDGRHRLWLINRAFVLRPSYFVGTSGIFSKDVEWSIFRVLNRQPDDVKRVTIAFIFDCGPNGERRLLKGVSVCSPSEKFYSRKVGTLYALSRAVEPISPEDSCSLYAQAKAAYENNAAILPQMSEE